MIRQNKKLLLLTSVITLLPVFIGLFLWNQLPDSVATHFGLNNQPDGYSSKAFAVFGLPLILLAVHLVCVVATNIDPKSKDINKKIFRVLLWICPLVSLFVSTVIYGYSLGYDFDMWDPHWSSLSCSWKFSPYSKTKLYDWFSYSMDIK